MGDCTVLETAIDKSKYGISVEQQLADIDSEDNGKSRKEVLILGAGMAGLSAGYELAKRGHRVRIIEASGRLGGRVWTHRFKNKQYGELGAMRIPGSHDYTRYYVEEMRLKLRKFVNSDKDGDTYRDFEGVTCKTKVASEKISDLFHLSDSERNLAKDDLDNVYLRIMNGFLFSLKESEKKQLFGHGPLSDRLKNWDQDSLLNVLRDSATPDAVRLMGKATLLDDYWRYSTLFFIREEIDNAFSGLAEIEGGMDGLPKAMANESLPNGKKLEDLITFGCEVRAISQAEEGVVVTVMRDNKLEEIGSPYVLCTIPFSVLRRIDFRGLSGSQKIKDAIQGLGYQSSTKVLLNCDRRFWESEYGIYGGKSLTDAVIKQTYYPSDNCSQDSQVSDGPGVLLGSYTWGATALRIGALRPEERGRLVVDNLKRFHPDIKEHLNAEEPYVSMAWDQHPYAAGAFSSSYPFDLQTFFPEVGQPAGRLFFAGEHLSPYPTWIQGALWSALQAVKQIVVSKEFG